MLSQASARAHRILVDRLGEVGARGYEFRILDALTQSSTPLSQIAIGSLARLDRRDVAVTIAELEAQHLVYRQPDPQDARRNLVWITPEGRDRFTQLEQIMSEVQAAVLAPLDAASQATFVEALQSLLRSADEADHAPA